MSYKMLTLLAVASVVACNAESPSSPTTEMGRGPNTASAGAGVIARAIGHGGFFISLDNPKNPFGVAVDGRLSFNAKATADGAQGAFEYTETDFDPDPSVPPTVTSVAGRVTCMVVYPGHRAKIGGRLTSSTDPTLPPGTTFGWFQVQDNGETAPDWSTAMGFGDEAANISFCNSSNLPRFGPWDWNRGNVVVHP